MERDLYKKLLSWQNSENRKPLVLHGARQVGKTHLLKQLGADIVDKQNRSFHYFDFERTPGLNSIFERDLSPQRILNDLSVATNQPIDPETAFVVFDEVQQCPSALTALKQFYQEIPQLSLCAAGSLLGVALGETSYPVGKVTHLDLFPLSFREFLGANGLDLANNFLSTVGPADGGPSELTHSEIWNQLLTYFVVGGLPEAVNAFVESKAQLVEKLHVVRGIQEDLVIAYLADMAKHSGKINSMHLDRLWKNVPAQLQRSQDGAASKFVFKDSVPGLRGYDQLIGPIDWLKSAGLILRVPVVNQAHNPLKAYEKENWFKLLMFDVGLLGSTSRLEPKTILEYNYGSFKGFFAENFVAQELLTSGVKDLFSWREGASEVEFVHSVENQVVPIEVKSGMSGKTRSLATFINKYSPKLAVVLSGKRSIELSDSHKTGTKILKAPLYMAGEVDRLVKTILQ